MYVYSTCPCMSTLHTHTNHTYPCIVISVHHMFTSMHAAKGTLNTKGTLNYRQQGKGIGYVTLPCLLLVTYSCGWVLMGVLSRGLHVWVGVQVGFRGEMCTQ